MDVRENLDRMASAYQDSVILLTSLRLGVFDALADGARSARELSASLELDARALGIVLHALAGAGVLEKEGDRFALVPDAAPLLTGGGAATQVSIYSHHDHLMRRWIRLEETLRTGKPVPREKGRRTPREHRDYICGMENISRLSSSEAVAALDLSGVRRLLDVGGGPATAARVFAAAHPELRCVVFDLPETIAIARELIAASGLGDRVETVEGDYHVDGFGEDFDVVYMSNIIHSLAPPDVAMLFRKAHAALVPGGRIMVKDFFLDDDRTSPAFASRFAVNMLVGTEGGKSYARGEAAALLADAGFGAPEAVPVGKHSLILCASRS